MIFIGGSLFKFSILLFITVREMTISLLMYFPVSFNLVATWLSQIWYNLTLTLIKMQMHALLNLQIYFLIVYCIFLFSQIKSFSHLNTSGIQK